MVRISPEKQKTPTHTPEKGAVDVIGRAPARMKYLDCLPWRIQSVPVIIQAGTVRRHAD